MGSRFSPPLTGIGTSEVDMSARYNAPPDEYIVRLPSAVADECIRFSGGTPPSQRSGSPPPTPKFLSSVIEHMI